MQKNKIKKLIVILIIFFFPIISSFIYSKAWTWFHTLMVPGEYLDKNSNPYDYTLVTNERFLNLELIFLSIAATAAIYLFFWGISKVVAKSELKPTYLGYIFSLFAICITLLMNIFGIIQDSTQNIRSAINNRSQLQITKAYKIKSSKNILVYKVSVNNVSNKPITIEKLNVYPLDYIHGEKSPISKTPLRAIYKTELPKVINPHSAKLFEISFNKKERNSFKTKYSDPEWYINYSTPANNQFNYSNLTAYNDFE